MQKREIFIKHASIYSAYILIIWGLYRYLFKLPDEVEELVIKPITWLIPLFYLVSKERLGLESVGITFKNLFTSLYFVLGLGAVFTLEGLIINYVKYGGFNFSSNFGGTLFLTSLGLSFATSISEEIAFRGFLFTRLWKGVGNEWFANIMTTIIWVLIHVPVAIFVWKVNAFQAGSYLMLIAIFSLGSGFVYARTKNIFASILLHVLWASPIILFK